MQRSTSRWIAAAGIMTAGALVLTACGGSQFGGEESTPGGDSGLSVLIGSSGEAETTAVQDAVAAWSKESGTGANVSAASDLNQQLSQGFAAGKPADVFYVSLDSLAGFAANGSLYAYGDQLSNRDDFYPSLVEAFTYDGKFYCAPKDFSTLGLVINDALWAEAGLTETDIPTTWDELTAVTATLANNGRPGLVLSPEYARVGAFMVQAGGTLLNADQTEATVDTPENAAGLDYVKSLLDSGSAQFTTDLGSGWGGEAFGKEQAAMTIEGNWITGALSADYPDIEYTIAELPAGPAGPGTLQFTNCWGIAEDSPNKEAALDLVEFLTSTDSQLEFSDAFGVMPSVQSAAEDWKNANPALVPFLNSVDFAASMPSLRGASDVISDLNSQLESLATGNPAAMLASAQRNMEAVVSGR
ncbi:extracellular solute-binding protein [Lysinibacter sp. HNR]|uniref:sugar ABC transporter substrate-binding protein n=1 Tax=Lysinibacter sp. HNR TaxID=3031408 RepID=UPI002434CC94|nr:extracellular solute-binding protein [Lysinibacter sp. HNR]WGD37499.1 extracellular solute-binding protein [Lysinibacter sp. HNR]